MKIDKFLIFQVSSLSKKVNDLEEERMSSGEERARLRADNAVLTERVHILEEQLQAAEQRSYHILIISLINVTIVNQHHTVLKTFVTFLYLNSKFKIK